MHFRLLQLKHMSRAFIKKEGFLCKFRAISCANMSEVIHCAANYAQKTNMEDQPAPNPSNTQATPAVSAPEHASELKPAAPPANAKKSALPIIIAVLFALVLITAAAYFYLKKDKSGSSDSITRSVTV